MNRVENHGTGAVCLASPVRFRVERFAVREADGELDVRLSHGRGLVGAVFRHGGPPEVEDHCIAPAPRGAVEFRKLPVEARDARGVGKAVPLLDGGEDLVERGARHHETHVHGDTRRGFSLTAGFSMIRLWKASLICGLVASAATPKSPKRSGTRCARSKLPFLLSLSTAS